MKKPTGMVRAALLFVLLTSLALAGCGTGEQGQRPDPPGVVGEPDVMPAPDAAVTVEPEEPTLSFGQGWKTDFRRHTVPLEELRSGGVPRDGIPPIDNPQFESVDEAGAWLADVDPVILFQHRDETRIYPLAILMWHEIVNDEVGGAPVTITYCPLCNTAIAFDRQVAGETLTFGVSGLLRYSDLVMWDRQTESLWQQATGEAIVGELAGQQLRFLPSAIISWKEARTQFPEAQVLSRETGHSREYGINPYDFYDTNERPFLYDGPRDERLPMLERVVGLLIDGEAVAYPFHVLEDRLVVEDTIAGMPVVIFYQPGTASALDGPIIARSRDVGSAAAFNPLLDGQQLTFEVRAGAIVDRETGSTWSATGRATAGPLAGRQLQPVVHANHFWFAFSSLLCAKAQTCRVYE